MKSPERIHSLLVCFVAAAFCSAAIAQSPPPAAPQAAAIVDTPARWDAAFFLPGSVPKEMFKKIVGTSLHLDVLPALKLSLGEAKTTFDYGTAQVSLTVGVGTAASPQAAALEAAGTLSFWKFERDANGANPQAKFRVMLNTLRPSVDAGGKKLDPGNFAVVLEKTGLLKLLADYLSFSVPVPLDLVDEPKFDDDLTFSAGKDGEVKVHVKAPGRSISEKLTGMQVVFVPSGMWLCSQFGRRQPTSVSGADLPPAERWKSYEASASKDTARLLIRGPSLVDTFNRLADASPAARTATITGVGHKNKLSEGDASVWLADDSEKATLTITPKAQWTADGALKVECSYTAKADAHLGINLKLPGGSVGTRSVGTSGRSAGSVEAQIVPTLLTGAKAPTGFSPSVAVLLPEFAPKGNQPQELKVHVETDGRFKTKLPFNSYLKTSAPKVEVDATLPVPPDVLPHFALLTNEPRPIAYPKPPKGFTLTPPKDGLPTHAVLEPKKASWDDDGYVLEFQLTLVKLTAEQAAEQTKAIKKMLADIRHNTLKVGDIKVSVGGVGPNNTLVKILMEFGKAVADAYETAKKAGKDVEATVAKAGKDIEAEVARIPKNMERAPRTSRKPLEESPQKILGSKV